MKKWERRIRKDVKIRRKKKTKKNNDKIVIN